MRKSAVRAYSENCTAAYPIQRYVAARLPRKREGNPPSVCTMRLREWKIPVGEAVVGLADPTAAAVDDDCSCRLIFSRSSGAVKKRAPAPAAAPATTLCHCG